MPIAALDVLTHPVTGIAMLATGVSGGLLGAAVAFWTLRESTARQLLNDALAIQALSEAWLLEGNPHKSLSENRGLSTEPSDNGLWLRRVELRATLDDAEWNAPREQSYGFIGFIRVWIVRNRIVEESRTYDGASSDYHQALISSRAFEELAGWIERVASARDTLVLSRRGLRMLNPLLEAVASKDRVAVFQTGNERLSEQACKFLHWYRTSVLKKHW